MKIRMVSFVGLALFLTYISACAHRYSMFKEYETCNTTYSNESKVSAKSALIAFLSLAEKNLDAILKNPESVPLNERMNYPAVMGLSWLRLAAIYQSEHDKTNYDRAMGKAILYSDAVKVPDFASFSQYKADKEAYLLKFLDRIETANPPKWRSGMHSQITKNEPPRQP